MKKILFLMLGIIMCCSCNNDKTEISCNNYQDRVENGSILIDVRTVQEYNEEHLEGAISLPLSEIENITDIVSDKDQSVIVYCKSGNRSRQAYNELKSMGYTNVHDLGGINNCKI